MLAKNELAYKSENAPAYESYDTYNAYEASQSALYSITLTINGKTIVILETNEITEAMKAYDSADINLEVNNPF